MSTRHILAQLGPVPGVPRHGARFLRIEVGGEVLHHLLQLVQGGGLAPDHMGHGLGPEGEVEGVEVGAVGRPVVLCPPGSWILPDPPGAILA